MNWDQIENNWMAMTRRIRPERPTTATPNNDSLNPSGDVAETVADWSERKAASALSASRLIA